jgi:hypothetical protein
MVRNRNSNEHISFRLERAIGLLGNSEASKFICGVFTHNEESLPKIYLSKAFCGEFF